MLLVLPLLPLPWRLAPPSAGPGTAWRTDGRLELQGRPVDPPGEVLWLASGRPQLVWERVREATTGRGRGVPLTGGDAATTPEAAVPAAVAAALRVGGREQDASAGAHLALRVGPIDLGRVGAGLHLGDSHGLAIAVAVLRDLGVTGLDSGTVAATGRVTADGSVLPVGGIRPKVRAAVRAGATTVLVPLGQRQEACEAVGDAPIRVAAVEHLADLLMEPAHTPCGA